MTKVEIRSCEDALRLLAAYLDGELEATSGDEVERHLAKCRSCYSRAEFERRLKEQVNQLRSEPVRPQLAERVKSIISEFSVASGD